MICTKISPPFSSKSHIYKFLDQINQATSRSCEPISNHIDLEICKSPEYLMGTS